MALWKPFRGNRASLDAVEKHDGYVYFCIDDGSLFFDYVDAEGNLQRKQISAKDAETITGASLSTILNSSDVEIPTSKAVLDAIAEAAVTNQSDWYQSDENAADYVKNRTHYEEIINKYWQ